MFFPDRIKSINEKDRVLEIGPGADPHPRSDIFLELSLENEDDYVRQFGHERKLQTVKKIVFYDGKKFPFEDKEFDYVICSHVLEHVPDVESFLAEVFRTCKKGYFEYPLITYDYLYNFDVHLNFLKWNGSELFYAKKSESHLDEFRPVQQFFLQTLLKNYDTYFKKIPEFFMEGFEWNKPFKAIHTKDLGKFIVTEKEIPSLETETLTSHGYLTLANAMFRKMMK